MSPTPETRSTAQAELQNPNTGASRIAAERNRQLEANGYDAAHDDEHASSELAIAAVAYIFAEEDPEYASKVWPFADSFKIDRLLRMRGEG